MIRTFLTLLMVLSLMGCVSKQQVYVVSPQMQSGMHVKSYDVYPTFHGFELIVGLPILKGVPIIGPLLGEIIQIRAGINQDVLVPVFEHHGAPQAFGARPDGLKRVDDSRSRWSSYRKK